MGTAVHFASALHRRLDERLVQLVGDGAAGYLRDLLRLLAEGDVYANQAMLAGNLLREMEGEVRKWLLGLPKIRARLPPKVDEEHKKRHAQEVTAVLEGLGLSNDPRASIWVEQVGPKNGWHKYAHRRCFREPRRLDTAFRNRVDALLAALELALDRAQADYVAALDLLLPLRAKPRPTSADIETVFPYLAPGATAPRHFFDGLPAGWLVPLREKDVFASPPGIQIRENGSRFFPWWPQADYLVRIASELPTEVAKTIHSIPSTESEDVLVSFMEAALHLTVDDAEQIALRVGEWSGRTNWLNDALVSDRLLALLDRLIENRRLDAVVTVLRATLATRPGDSNKLMEQPAGAHLDDWHYRAFANHVFPQLASADFERATHLLIEFLDAGQLGLHQQWRDSIADHQNNDTGTLDALLSQLRDLLVRRVTGDEEALRSAVADLEARQHPVFRRLALHLLAVAGDCALDLVVERVVDQSRLDASAERYELAAVLRAQFCALRPAEQDQVIAAFRENSSAGHMKALSRISDTPGEALNRSRCRLAQLLSALGDALPESLRGEYEQLRAAVGTPSGMAPVAPQIWHGPTAPIDAAGLGGLSDQALLDFLGSWKPDGGRWMVPSREGLGRVLDQCAKNDPGRFSRLAGQSIGLHPTYVAQLLGALNSVLQNRERQTPPPLLMCDLDGILKLADWTSLQPTGCGPHGEDSPTDWTWPRANAADSAIHAAIADDAGGPGLGRLRCCWTVISRLLRDADPPEGATSSGQDDESVSLNTVRGRALAAAFRFAARVAEAGADGSALLIEVLDAVEARLTAEQNGALRSCLAERFNLNNLFALDSPRALRVVSVLLPVPTDHGEGRMMAWRRFIRRGRIYKDVFLATVPAHQAAVKHLAAEAEQTVDEFGRYLAVPAFWGTIAFQSEECLLKDFVAHAPASARREFLEQIGEILQDKRDSPLSDEEFSIVKRLWAGWIAASEGFADRSDLAAFGHWFIARGVDAQWALETLDVVLGLTGGMLDEDHCVAEKLAELANDHPESVARSLALLVATDPQYRLARSIDAVARTLIALDRTCAATVSREIRGRLLARGIVLPPNPKAPRPVRHG